MIYEIIYGDTWIDLMIELDTFITKYEMPYKVLNFQETPGRFIAFLYLEN